MESIIHKDKVSKATAIVAEVLDDENTVKISVLKSLISYEVKKAHTIRTQQKQKHKLIQNKHKNKRKKSLGGRVAQPLKNSVPGTYGKGDKETKLKSILKTSKKQKVSWNKHQQEKKKSKFCTPGRDTELDH